MPGQRPDRYTRPPSPTRGNVGTTLVGTVGLHHPGAPGGGGGGGGFCQRLLLLPPERQPSVGASLNDAEQPTIWGGYRGSPRCAGRGGHARLRLMRERRAGWSEQTRPRRTAPPIRAGQRGRGGERGAPLQRDEVAIPTLPRGQIPPQNVVTVQLLAIVSFASMTWWKSLKWDETRQQQQQSSSPCWQTNARLQARQADGSLLERNCCPEGRLGVLERISPEDDPSLAWPCQSVWHNTAWAAGG
ncbi:unnamed protein product [Lampetra planeri]